MANKNILTNLAKTSQVEQIYYSPSAVIPPSTNAYETTYCFIAKADPWADENDPPEPQADVAYIKQTFKNMIAMKRVHTTDMSPVIQRVDWESGVTYDFYQDNVNMVAKDSNGFNVYNFYVKNKYNQVFKCLWNNHNSPSTNEPYFEPGSYNSAGIFQGPSDGYKWKFMYSIDIGSRIKFMDETWMPIAVGQNTPNPYYDARTGDAPAAGAGALEVINLTHNGLLYSPTIPITVTITGDGTGATATATANSEGYIPDIVVTNPGKDYTFADVTISSTKGLFASAIAPTSPVGGHGFDPITELGSNHVMITCEFNATENNTIPVDIDYHQVGLVVNPISNIDNTQLANGEIYRTTTNVTVAPGFGIFSQDEYVYQGTDLASATFYARVLNFDTSTNVLYLINTVGTLTENAPISGSSTTTTRTVLTYTTNSGVVPFSGNIIYIENRSPIQRSADGIEQFRFVLGY